MLCCKMTACAVVLLVSMTCAESVSSESRMFRSLQSRLKRSPEPVRTGSGGQRSRILYEDQEGLFGTHQEEPLETAAQNHHGQRAQRRGYSGTVKDGKSQYISRYNHGVPVYGVGEPYYFSYTHNFPIATEDFESQVNSHNLPKKYKFSGGLDVTGLLE